MSLLPKLMEVGTLAGNGQTGETNATGGQDQADANRFIGLSLEAYFGELGIDPFGMNPKNNEISVQGDKR